MPLRKTDVTWLREHADQRGHEWFCKTTGAAIQTARTGRSIWLRPFDGGYGEVRDVDHLWCPSCTPEPRVEYGTPIYADELVDGG
jgi:hypothetical protein